MAATDTFKCDVITPERKILECNAQFAAFPAHDGEMGVLKRRAPLICKLGIGVLRIEEPDANHKMFIDGGFAQVLDNRLTILTEEAHNPDELDPAEVDRSLAEARAMKITDELSVTARSRAIQRAQVQLKLARSAK
jgi:F-type H+-transporting ATPase subunit epsilon